MGRRKKSDAAAGEGATAGKSRLLPSAVVAIGLLGGGDLMGGGKSAARPAAASADAATPTTTAAPGPIVMLNSITLNLTDGHYLKVGVALQLAPPEPDAKSSKSSAHGAGETTSTEPGPQWARALDATITVLGSRDYHALSTPDGRQEAKEALGQQIAALYHDEVSGIYFTEFVMQ
jgi:flagellar FliL protein